MWCRAAAFAVISLAAASCHPASRARARQGMGTLTFEISDTHDAPIAARITLVGLGGTPDPKLGASSVGELRDRDVLAGNKVMTLDGTGEIDVPLGVYDIYVSRGIEWSLVVLPRVEIDERGYQLRARLDHVIDTTGWLSGDFHVHAAPSWDSDVPLVNRAIEFVTEGVDLIVSTDHNAVTDYAPVIDELGMGDDLDSMIGDEITTFAWGHFGVFPLGSQAVGGHYGAQWRHEGEGRQVFEGVRREHPGALIQINHPRSGDHQGYFRDERFDRQAAASKLPGFSFDFDAIEILNGRAFSPMEAVLLDWFAMLDHGRVVTAMGNSDTHELRSTIGGYPRNYLRVPDDRQGKTIEKDIVDAIRGHHAFFTTGPFVTLRSGDAGIGDLVRAHAGKVPLSFEVFAAPWIDVDRATLYVDGKVWRQWTIEHSTLPQRLEIEETIDVPHDSYVVLRVDGDEPLWPVVGDTEHQRLLPVAITNPLFVDADGDGRFAPHESIASTRRR